MSKLIVIDLPTPPMGAKCFLLEEKGLYLLQRGPCVLRAIACTHGGSGSVVAIDGIPDENGFFPDRGLGDDTPIDAMPIDPTRAAYNGRAVYRANPAVMGMWQLDAGCLHGLTLRASGGTDSTSVIASIVWMPYNRKPKVAGT